MKTEYLTHQEYFKKRANIIEDIKGVGIDITYQRNTNNWVSPNRNKPNHYTINICTPNEKGISRKTALYHELSHLMWESFAPNVRGMAQGWADRFIQNHKELNEENDKTQKELIKKSIVQEYMLHFNIIEDQRIESLTKHVWLGTQKMFDETRTNLGEQLIENLKDIPLEERTPADILLAARFYQPKHTKDWAKEIMEDVIDTGMKGSLSAWVKSKKYVDEYLEDGFGDYKNRNKEVEETQKQWEENTKILNSELSTQEQIDEAESNQSKASEQLKNINREKSRSSYSVQHRTGKNTKFSHDHDELLTEHDGYNSSEERKEMEEESEELLNEATLIEEETEEEGKEHVSEHKKDGEEEIENMKASIEAIGKTGSMTPSHIKSISRPQAKVEVDAKTAQVLQKTFTKMAEQFTSNIDDYGSEVNVEAFINRKVRQSNDPCMINEKLSNGATVLISIDGSGSMGNSGRIYDARNLCATLYKASEKVKDIELVGNVWSSDYEGNVGITTFKSLKECEKIEVNDSYLFTPTHEALIHSAKQLRGRKGRKKLMIIITDGVPQYYKNNIDTPAGILIKMNKKALKKALRISPRIICIDISNHWKYGEVLKDIFGRRYVSFTGMHGASKFVIKEFRKIVQEVMR